MVLDRKLFVTLEKIQGVMFGQKYDKYVVLNDQNFVREIYALSDSDAIKKFRESENNLNVHNEVMGYFDRALNALK